MRIGVGRCILLVSDALYLVTVILFREIILLKGRVCLPSSFANVVVVVVVVVNISLTGDVIMMSRIKGAKIRNQSK